MIYCILSYWGLRDKPYNIISVINNILISILGVTILRLSRKNTLADNYMKTNCSRPCRSYKRSYNTVRVEAVNGLSVSFSSQWYGYICEFTGITGTVKKKKSLRHGVSSSPAGTLYAHTLQVYILYSTRRGRSVQCFYRFNKAPYEIRRCASREKASRLHVGVDRDATAVHARTYTCVYIYI